MIVMKFGGTSVEDAAAMRNVASIVRAHAVRRPLVVASACAGVTNALLALARSAREAGKERALDRAEELRVRHRQIAHALFTGEVLFTVQSQVDAMIDSLRDLVKSIAILGELTDRSLDTFAGYGERLSTLLLTHHMKQEGIPCVFVDAQEVMVTTAEFTRAAPLLPAIEARVRERIAPRLDAAQVVVTQGFVGATADGVPTTIGRGGSDYSAAIFGAALGAEEIQIWTDVDGVMTSDPSVIPEARVIPEMTFREAAELAYFGAKVLHPATILPAVRQNIPVRVLNSRRSEVPGTVILAAASGASRRAVTSIAYKEGITLITITSSRMLMMHGFLARVFEVFATHSTSVDVIATSEVSLSLTVDSRAHLDAIFAELRAIAEVEAEHDKAIFCVVGEGLKSSRGVITRVFATLDEAGIGVSMISLGASEVNVTFVVDGRDIRAAAQSLHSAFFASP
ncbi:MAG TPA: lysine-sensitive aspartokinase 3 [Bacteroidota bacterium]|nr:lysine-sensitive aspartokinase 3 [Bacteroidota bacterium]